MESKCTVVLDAVIMEEPKLLNSFGIEKIYETYVEFQSTKTKKGYIYINYSSALGIGLKKGDIICLKGDLRSRQDSDDKSFSKSYIYMYMAEFLDELPEKLKNEVEFENLRLNRGAKLRGSYSDESIPVASISLEYLSRSGRKSFVHASAWNLRAHAVAQLNKGDIVSGSGNLQCRVRKVDGKFSTEISLFNIDKVGDE